MCYKRQAKLILNPETEADYVIATSYSGAQFPHIHDFYELLLIIKGKQLLIANGRKSILTEGSLTLIRPQDIHGKEYLADGWHINLAFSKETMEGLLYYLGKGFPNEPLLSSANPPSVTLMNTEKKLIQTQMEALNLLNAAETNSVKTNLRILLFELLTKYFAFPSTQNSDIPAWLATILLEMKQKNNFTRGLPALLSLGNIGHEHMCRLFKKYIDTTPTEFINEQRINYAINLLRHSDMSILNISMECGFSSLSHFYHVFKEKIGNTPAQYRKQCVVHPPKHW